MTGIIQSDYDTYDAYVDALIDRIAELEVENERLRDKMAAQNCVCGNFRQALKESGE